MQKRVCVEHAVVVSVDQFCLAARAIDPRTFRLVACKFARVAAGVGEMRAFGVQYDDLATLGMLGHGSF